MPKLNKNLKPQYESKKENIIPTQKVKIDKRKEYSSLSKIIEESKKIEEILKTENSPYYKF